MHKGVKASGHALTFAASQGITVEQDHEVVESTSHHGKTTVHRRDEYSISNDYEGERVIMRVPNGNLVL